MEPQEKPKFNWMRLSIIIGIVIIASLAVGGSVWYVMDQQAEKDKGEFEKQIQELEEQKDIEESTTTTEEKTEKATSDKTADWKTYNGDGYSVKYPTDWYLTSSTLQSWKPTTSGRGGLDEGMSKIDLHGLDSYSTISSSVLKTAVDQSVAEWKQGHIDRGDTSFTIKSTKKLTVNGTDAYLVVAHSSEAGSGTYYTLYVMKSGSLRSITVISGEVPSTATDSEIRSILNTFRLL